MGFFDVAPTWITYYLPAAIIFATLLHDLASSISQPKFVRAVFRCLSSPFRNFLALEDLSEPVDLTPRWPKVKNRILIGLASIMFVGWVGCLGFSLYMDDHIYAVNSMVQLASWCYIALRLTFKPPLTPPYLFIAFALSSVLVSFLAFGYDVSAEAIENAAIDVLAMIVPGTFAWLAGTLPLKPYRPFVNVAQCKDVWKPLSLILALDF